MEQTNEEREQKFRETLLRTKEEIVKGLEKLKKAEDYANLLRYRLQAVEKLLDLYKDDDDEKIA